MRRAIPVVLVLIVLVLIGIVVMFDPGGEPGVSDGDTAAADADADAAAADEARRSRVADVDEPERNKVERPKGTQWQRQWPEIGQEEQDPALGAIKGTVLIAKHKPAKEAVVEIRDGGRAVARVHVTGSGGFLLKNVPPTDRLRLTARAPRRAPGGMSALTVNAGETIDVGSIYVGAAVPKGIDNRVSVLVRDPEGLPVEGAEITVTSVFYGSLVMMGELEKQPGGSVFRDATDGDGEATFELLPPAGYDVIVEAEGYEFDTRQRTTIQSDTQTTFVFDLTPGMEISGTVVTEAGEPIADARIGALRFGDWVTFPAVASDEEGKFTIGGLGGGGYMIFAVKDGYGGKDAQNVTAGTTDLQIEMPLGGEVTLRVTDSATGEPITRFGLRPFRKMPFAYLFAPLIEVDAPDGVYTLRAESADYGAEITADGYTLNTLQSMVLPSEEPIDVALDPGAVVHGRVISSVTGEPVVGADVYIKKGGFPPTKVKDQAASTDENGVFVLDFLPPRTLSLWISHMDHTEAVFEGVEPAMRGEKGELPGTVDFELASGGRIEGRVLDADGIPVVGETLQLTAGFDMSAMRTATTDEEGKYAFRSVPADRAYTVSVGNMFSQAAGQSRGGVKVTDGAVVVIDFGTETGGQTLTGVVYRGEEPAGEVNVSLTSDDGGSGRVSTSTDAAGRFTFEKVQAGRYAVTAQGRGSSTIDIVVDAEKPPEELKIVIATAGITGAVTNAATGDPLPGAYVDCEHVVEGGASNLTSISRRWKGQDSSGADGGFEFRGLADGRYRLRAMLEGYGTAIVDDVQIVDGESASGVRIQMGPEGSIVGIVTNSAGQPIEGASLTFRDAQGRSLSMVDLNSSSSDGTYSQAGVPPGQYTVVATKSGYAPASVQVSVTEGSAATADLSLLTGGTIDVTARNTAGEYVEGALIKILDANGNPLKASIALSDLFSTAADTTDSNGACAVPGIAPGTYRVRVTVGDNSVVSDAAEVLEGAHTRVEVTLPGASD